MNPKLLRGSLDTIILKLLDDNREMYGYEISQKVNKITNGALQLTEGALYPSLHRLESKGILQVDTRSIGNRYRKYYTLTLVGKSQLVVLLDEMQSYMKNISLLLNPKLAQ